eukprot:scaffold207045_cov31-Tisochrysis_lutea.AAC.1
MASTALRREGSRCHRKFGLARASAACIATTRAGGKLCSRCTMAGGSRSASFSEICDKGASVKDQHIKRWRNDLHLLVGRRELMAGGIKAAWHGVAPTRMEKESQFNFLENGRRRSSAMMTGMHPIEERAIGTS